MSDKERDIELIERFLAGELVGEEKTNFEQRLEKESKLMEELKNIRELQAGIRATVLGEKLAFLEGLEDEDVEKDEEETDFSASVKTKERTMVRSIWWSVSGVAAVVLALIIVWPQFQNSGPSEEYRELFENDFENTIEHTLYRSLNDLTDLSDDQIYAYNLYVDQQFRFAIPHLKKLWVHTNDSLALKYLGISYLGIGKNKKGEEILTNFPDYASSK